MKRPYLLFLLFIAATAFTQVVQTGLLITLPTTQNVSSDAGIDTGSDDTGAESDTGTTSDTDPVQPRADLIPHSPEVEAMVKYGVLPVTMYTGMPQISVPVFEIKASGLTIPFSLSYNYNGFKPTEAASWCGLGWSLQGGGSIARIIKGMPDGYLNSGYNYDDFVNPQAMAWSQPFVYGVAKQIYDTEPDLYTFNVGGYSGKFILIKNQAYLFPYQNLKIRKMGAQGFQMTDDKGNTYFFNDAETTFTKYNVVPVHTSAWHISKIITADKKDTISYSYNEYTYEQPSTFTDSYSIKRTTGPGTNTDGHTFARIPVDGDHIDALALRDVTSRYGSISFVGSEVERLDVPGGQALDKIVITGPIGSSFQKEVVLVHDYFPGSGKLRLNETFERAYVDNGNEVLVPVTDRHYLFEYKAETNLSLIHDASAIDYWGFYNGVSNPMLFPSPTFGNWTLRPYANRNANGACSSNSIIKKITYPTGGYSVFEYEQNKKGSYNVTSVYTNSSLTSKVNFDPYNGGYTEVFKPFTLNAAQMVKFTYGDEDDTHAPTRPVIRITKNRGQFAGAIYSSPIYQDSVYSRTDSTFLDAGDYYFTVSCENGITGTDAPYATFGTIYYKTYVVDNTLADGPGLRIKKISSYDGIASNPAFIKRYSYKNGFDLSRGGFSGSSLYHVCADYTDESYSASAGASLGELAENQFYYGEVTETTQDSTKTGKTVYTFGTQSTQLLDVKLKGQTDYKYTSTGFIPVKSTTNEYQVISKNSFVGFRAGKVTMSLPLNSASGNMNCPFLSSPDITQPTLVAEIYQASDFYSLVSDHSLTSSTKEILYNDDGSTLTNQSDYYYDNPEHVLPTRIVTKNSNGDQITHEMKYPLDYKFGCTLPNAINDQFMADNARAQFNLGDTYGSLVAALQPYQPYSAATQQSFVTITSQYHCMADYKSAVALAIANRDNSLSAYGSCLNSIMTNNALPAWQQSIAWMQLNNVLTPVIEKNVSIKKADGSEYLLSATRNEYGILNGMSAEPVMIKQTEVYGNLLKSTFTASPDNYYKPQLNFTYDKASKLVGQQKINDLSTTYLYGYNQNYPIAEIKNATFTQVLAAMSITADQYNSESFASVPTANYLSKLNALRLTNLMMTTYTYDPLKGVTSVTDTNNKATYYEYDSFGRLVTIKDSDKNILKTYDYHFKQ